VGATGTLDGDRKVFFRSALGVVPLWMLFLLVAADGGGSEPDDSPYSDLSVLVVRRH